MSYFGCAARKSIRPILAKLIKTDVSSRTSTLPAIAESSSYICQMSYATSASCSSFAAGTPSTELMSRNRALGKLLSTERFHCKIQHLQSQHIFILSIILRRTLVEDSSSSKDA